MDVVDGTRTKKSFTHVFSYTYSHKCLSADHLHGKATVYTAEIYRFVLVCHYSYYKGLGCTSIIVKSAFLLRYYNTCKLTA